MPKVTQLVTLRLQRPNSDSLFTHQAPVTELETLMSDGF